MLRVSTVGSVPSVWSLSLLCCAIPSQNVHCFFRALQGKVHRAKGGQARALRRCGAIENGCQLLFTHAPPCILQHVTEQVWLAFAAPQVKSLIMCVSCPIVHHAETDYLLMPTMIACVTDTQPNKFETITLYNHNQTPLAMSHPDFRRLQHTSLARTVSCGPSKVCHATYIAQHPKGRCIQKTAFA